MAAGGENEKAPKTLSTLYVESTKTLCISPKKLVKPSKPTFFHPTLCMLMIYYDLFIYHVCLLYDCSEIHATYFNRYSNVCWSHWYQDKSKPAQRSWIFMGSNKMYICFYSGLKLYLTGCLCLPFRSQTAVYMKYKASWFIICGMAIKYHLGEKTWVHRSSRVPSKVFLFNLGL